jgi:hypothetical protein
MAATLLSGTRALHIGLTGYRFRLVKVPLIIALMVSIAETFYQGQKMWVTMTS